MEIRDKKTGELIATVTGDAPDSASCEGIVRVELATKDGTRPALCLVKEKGGGWYLGAYRDANKVQAGCDLAVRFDEHEGPSLQVVRDGVAEQVSLMDLVRPPRALPAGPKSPFDGLVPGRVVWYTLPAGHWAGETRAALVAQVFNKEHPSDPGMSNLVVFKGQSDDGGMSSQPCFSAGSVPYDESGRPGTWRWPGRGAS